MSGTAGTPAPKAVRDLNIATFLSQLSARTAAPGGGAAAAVTARVNIEANLAGIEDDTLHAELADVAGLADGVTDRADRLIAAVREGMGQ